jgi:hypothetical protein
MLNWSPDHRANFTRDNLLFTHDLHENALFGDEALIALIDRYPRDQLEVFTMGYDPAASGQWFFGRRGDLDGRALLDAVKAGRLWLNLRKVNHHDPAIRELCARLFADIRRESGRRTLKEDLGLLISSPNAHVFYHLDIPLVMLWQVRGVKTIYLYPPEAPFVGERDREAVALRESDEQLPYRPQWDEDALRHDLKPGEMVTWVQNAPHRIVNHDMVNVSLSIEFMTPRAVWKANVLYANGCLRRWFGLDPSMTRSWTVWEPLKVAFARAVKAFGGFRGHRSPLKPSFTLDAAQPGRMIFDPGTPPPQPAPGGPGQDTICS